MKRRTTSIAAMAVFCVTSMAVAQDNAESRPVTSLDELKPILGTWSGKDIPLQMDVPGIGKAGDTIDVLESNKLALGGKAIFSNTTLMANGQEEEGDHSVWMVDRPTGNVRVWFFDRSGMSAEGQLFKEGKSFVVKFAFETTAENDAEKQFFGDGVAKVQGEAVRTVVDDDTHAFEMRNMTINGEAPPIPAPPKITMTRVND